MRLSSPVLGRILAKTAARASRQAQSPATADGFRSRIWVHAADEAGRHAAAMLETGEGYLAAAATTVRAVESLLQTPRVGALTPVQAFGADFALSVPGTGIQELER